MRASSLLHCNYWFFGILHFIRLARTTLARNPNTTNPEPAGLDLGALLWCLFFCHVWQPIWHFNDDFYYINKFTKTINRSVLYLKYTKTINVLVLVLFERLVLPRRHRRRGGCRVGLTWLWSLSLHSLLLYLSVSDCFYFTTDVSRSSSMECTIDCM